MSQFSKQLELPDVVDMLAHLIWVPELFRTYWQCIQLEHFKQCPLEPDKDETAISLIWGALLAYFEKEGTNQVPNQPCFETYLRAFMRQALISDDYEYVIFGDNPNECLLANLFSPHRSGLSFNSGEPLVKQFLVERAIVNSLLNHVNRIHESNGMVDLSEADNLRLMAEQATRIESLSAEMEIEPLAPDLSYFNNARIQPLIPTGITWIDERINGGQRAGEVNGLLGPTGAGKTTLGSQLFVSNVQQARRLCDQTGEDQVCVFYTYEQNAFDLQQKVFSNAFHIARSSITPENLASGCFSCGTPESPLKDYERGPMFDGTSEMERYVSECIPFSKHGIIRNMSGVADICDSPKQIALKRQKGLGGIDEIINDLYYIQDKRRQKIRAVFIDYLGLVLERQYASQDDPKVLYYALKRFGDEARQKIAGHFDCVVWLLHQMSGSANRVRPTTPLTHADSEGCRSLANNMTNCLCLGNPDSGSAYGGKCLYLSFSKTRNSSGGGFDDRNLILQQNTLFARFDDVTSTYRPDKANGCFYPVGVTFFS